MAALLSAGAGPALATTASTGTGGGLLDTLAGDVLGGVVDAAWGDDTTREGAQATRPDGTWDATRDRGSMWSLTRSIGAQRAWARGVTGKGVTVALIDTGVVDVPGLDGEGKVVDGPDLSFESQGAGTRYLDGFGHGTHLAGIIAGRDAGFDPRKPQGTVFAGVAPDAGLLNMKVATGDGGADVSQVIAAIDWVVEHRDDQGMNVRVINLSYGTASTQPWQVDPLARAVENAWDHDILVVTAAGNDGLAAPSLLMPAVDPHVLAVGGSDHRGSDTKLDDKVAAFTNGGSAARRPDLLAPGKSVVSLRDPGSYVDTAHPEGRLVGDDTGRWFRGSGTSQSAAVVSGEAALLFSARPRLTADQAKAVLMQTATPLVTGGPVQGRGVADVGAAVTTVKAGLVLPTLRQSLPDSTGLGTLEASRGGEHVVDPETGTALTGEVDAIGSPWRPAAWVAAQAAGATWRGGAWNGRTWTGTTWDQRQLQGVSWTGSSWSGVPWADHAWPTDQFQARSWRGDSWKARSWRGDSWKARSWRGQP
ncbi:S8 family serine peptidase [Nocardioides scoriae]|uniref:S8 family serine peptidase n=1 Tax=Nocardioides scoriae TaxID=642780 RepID=UPI0012FCE767|nr:S8 family serine peptidase [Nocardioides scoriae]